MPDDYEDPISLVAPTSRRLCPREWNGDGWLVVSDLSQLVGEGDHLKDWRCETLPTSGAVLFGTHLRGLHTWMCVESHRVGTGDTDVYRVALTRKLLDTYTNLC